MFPILLLRLLALFKNKKMRNNLLGFCGVFMMTALLSFSVQAEQMGQRGHGSPACKADIEKFCKDVKPGGGAIMKCLKEHDAELSAECKDRESAMKENTKAMHDACKADMEKFCQDVKPGGGAVMKCLKEHQAELSEPCKDATPKAKR